MRARRTEQNPQGLVLFDSHVHLTDAQFEPDRKQVLRQAREAGVRQMMLASQSVPDSREVVSLCGQVDGAICAVGVHPHEADGFRSMDITALKEMCIETCIKAVGEIGLDFFRTISARPNQEMAFAAQIDMARSMGLPMVIHVRDAANRARQMLEEQGYFAGVFHCFSGDAKLAEWVVERGFYVSFAGNLTYADARLTDIVKFVPQDRLMVETDAPYLAPVPHRGKRNEPAFISLTVTKMAEILGLTPQETARLTLENARRCFGIAE